MLPEAVKNWLEENGHGEVTSRQAVAGGCIHNGMRLVTSEGSQFFLKTNSQTPSDMFAREAEGLAALLGSGGPRIPDIYHYGPDFLLLEDMAPAPRAADHWESLGRQLAVVHNSTQDDFGFDHDNYIGSTVQPNTWMEDGHEFFAEHRLRFQLGLAAKKGLLTSSEVSMGEQIIIRLRELIPDQPASLVHGDLWSGNAISDQFGQPVLIDPAVHYGWAEADLAMTSLFGGFGDRFYDSYIETRPLESGWRSRFPLYNLYHLLNHLNLFGSGYHGQVVQILKGYR